MKHTMWKIGGLILTIFLVGFLPTNYHRIVREGTDKYNAHTQVWGSRTRVYSEIAPIALQGIGIIAANIRHASHMPLLHVVVNSSSLSSPLAQDISLHDLADDAFTWVVFPKQIAQAGEELLIEVSAPQSDAASAIGIRFDGDTKQIAFGTIERVPLWKYIVLWAHDTPDMASAIFTTIIGGMLLAGIVGGVGRFDRRWVRFVSFILLFFFALYIRIPLSHSIDSAYGGDAFNYLLKSRALIDGQDPFAADARKAPLYSFLVAPGLSSSFDAVTWERWVSMLSAAGVVVLVPLILLEFSLPLSLALIAGVLIAVNRDLQFESVQGLSNTLYAFLVVLSSYLFLRGKAYAVAAFASLATLARYEGGVFLATLLPVIVRRGWKTLIPVCILLLIPFVLFPFTHELGVRTISDIQSDDGLYVAYSLDDFWSNLNGFKHLFGRLWIQAPDIGNPFLWFWVGVVFGGILMIVKLTPSRSPSCEGEKSDGAVISSPHMRGGSPRALSRGRVGLAIVPYLLTFFFLFTILRGPSEDLVVLFSFLSGMGTLLLIPMRPKHTLPIVIALALQIIAITAILPKDRYYLPIVPFISIALVAGIAYISNAKHSRIGRIGALLFAGFIAAFAYHDASVALSGQVSDYNEKSAGQTVLLNAARYAKTISGIIGVAEGSDLQFRTYFSAANIVILPDSLRNIDEQYSLLQKNNVSYIVDITENPYFTKLIEAHPEYFTPVETFKTKWADVTATMYKVTD